MRTFSIVVSSLAAFAVVAGCSSADPSDAKLDMPQSTLVVSAERNPELNNPLPGHMPTQERFARELAGGSGAHGNLINHGGPTITSARVVAIFWGSSWAGNSIATSLTNYIAGYGTTSHYAVITQYSGIQSSSLGADSPAVWNDTSDPPTNVTDADVQGEVSKFLASNTFDPSAIYEVFLPATSYSSNGTATSCGGPNLQYCAYHGNFAGTFGDVRYASMPYPSCTGCQTSSFTVTQNFEHFLSHETREAVTDPDGTGWWDRAGYEADDKCAWGTNGKFLVSETSGGHTYGYQQEYSNSARACVK